MVAHSRGAIHISDISQAIFDHGIVPRKCFDPGLAASLQDSGMASLTFEVGVPVHRAVLVRFDTAFQQLDFSGEFLVTNKEK